MFSVNKILLMGIIRHVRKHGATETLFLNKLFSCVYATSDLVTEILKMFYITLHL